MMKKGDIVTLLNAGILSITSHTLSTAHAYKVYKFRKAIDALADDIAVNEQGLMLECGIANPVEFDRQREALMRSGKDPDTLAKLNEQFARFFGMKGKLYDEDVVLEGVKAIPYDEWRKLQEENKAVDYHGKTIDVLSGKAELILEGILWEAPSEEE